MKPMNEILKLGGQTTPGGTDSIGVSVPGIIVEKYILEITRYPNGNTFVRSYEAGAFKKKSKQKKKAKPVKSVSSIMESEEL